MKPHLTTSAMPLTSSARGSVRSMARSHSTPPGSWKAPTRFLPSAVFIPVLPPTAASTIASSVVGTWTTRTPRSQVAATKPPMSVVAPPPTVTTASERVKPARPSTCQQKAATADVLGRLAVGDLDRVRVVARPRPAAPAPPRARSASATGWITATRRMPSAEHRRQPAQRGPRRPRRRTARPGCPGRRGAASSPAPPSRRHLPSSGVVHRGDDLVDARGPSVSTTTSATSR